MPEISPLVTIAAVFLSVALVAGSLTYVGLERSSTVRRRVRDLSQRGRERDGSNPAALDTSIADDPAIKRVTTFVPKSPKEMRRVQRRLAMAGLHQPKHIALFMAAELLLPLALFVLGFFVGGSEGVGVG